MYLTILKSAVTWGFTVILYKPFKNYLPNHNDKVDCSDVPKMLQYVGAGSTFNRRI